jgi:cellulose synthase/poly-beta-1,6-N-acetylglucosamine synthase-like glycosyltransferase
MTAPLSFNNLVPADCIAPKKWLQTIAGFYEHTNAQFISAPVKFHDITGKGFFKTLLYIFQTLDFTSLQGISGAATASRFHYMCNGANLAFTKKSFYEVGGYKGIDAIASGDDMLLMEKFVDAYPGKVKFLKSREAIIETAPAVSLKSFIRQRIRWASKAGKYKTSSTKMVLTTVYLLNVLLIVTAVLSLYNANYLPYFLLSVFLKTVFEIWFLLPVTHFFKNKSLLIWFIPAVPFHIIYTVIAGAFGMFGKYEWKGRVVK